jgi:hypothetical protein
MPLLRKFLAFFGFCPTVYDRHEDPMYKTYLDQSIRTERLVWRPRELFDVN